jgi:hypothetical protein
MCMMSGQSESRYSSRVCKPCSRRQIEQHRINTAQLNLGKASRAIGDRNTCHWQGRETTSWNRSEFIDRLEEKSPVDEHDVAIDYTMMTCVPLADRPAWERAHVCIQVSGRE